MTASVAMLGLVSLTMACGDAPQPTQASRLSGGGTLSPLVGGAPADAPLPVSLQIAIARQATARFHDITAAHAAGYATENEPCVASPEGVMGIHAVNFALIGNQALDLRQPEALLYVPRPEGGHRLVGVEYVQIVLLRDPQTGAVGPWVSEAPWPPDYEVVTPTPRLFDEVFQGPMPGHTPTMPWHWDLHAWIWSENPAGMFAEWNRTLRCE